MEWGFTLAGGLTGFVVGLTGVGGGTLMTPILLLVFGVPTITAIATDLWFAVITKLVAARVHHANGRVDWLVAKRLWLGSLPLALMVVAVVSLGAPPAKVDWLTASVGVVVLVTAVGMLLAPRLLIMATRQRVAHALRFKALQPAMTVLAGALLGVCVALTSVGAGALGSVMLLFLYPLRMTPHRLVATDIVHAIPLAVVAGAGYLFAGMVDVRMLGWLLLGSIPGVFLGSLLAGKIDGRKLQIGLACVLVLVALKVLL